MRKRLLIPLAVFVIGFGLGYGLTWVLVGSSDPQPIAAAPKTPKATEQASAPPLATQTDVVVPKASDPTEGTTTHQTDLGRVRPPAEPTPDAGPLPTKAAEPVLPEKSAWWDRCRDARCKVDFGALTGALSIRSGSIKHGASVDWARDFGNATRLGLLPVGPSVRVDVAAVALDKNDQPIAAQITWREAGNTIRGVIALQVGDKKLRLVPLD